MATLARHEGRVALVTGASRGIGHRALAECGPGLRSTFTVVPAGLKRSLRRSRRAAAKRFAVAANVSVAAAVDGMIATVAARLGPIGLLVNNAGMAIRVIAAGTHHSSRSR